MRKMLMALVAMFLMAGLAIAGEVIIVGYDKEKKELKVKEDDKEKTYKIGDKVKFVTTDKDGNAKDSDYETFEKRVTNKKAVGGKLEVTVKDDAVTEVKWKGKK